MRFNTDLTNTSGPIRTSMIATATCYLSVANVGSHCVDAVKSWTARLGQSTTLVNVWHCGHHRGEEDTF